MPASAPHHGGLSLALRRITTSRRLPSDALPRWRWFSLRSQPARRLHTQPGLPYDWQHQASGEIWAVKLSDGEVVGATEIGRADVHEEILPHLSYRSAEADQLDRQRDHFKKIDGRKVE